ncbi:MAG: biopolymer transporter ExbD [Azoarcus sp.]|jgi:biopolymer transport protein ExbD|nr:biopolymer transporter ExbD [Azoarcus sp.]
MNFRHTSGQKSEPEINLVPLIDVMLVIIIFLMMTTTFDKTSGLGISLPSGDASGNPVSVSNEIVVAVTASGDVVVNGRTVSGKTVDSIAAALDGSRPPNVREPVVVINADAQATHQSVINVMQASQRIGIAHVTFATRQEPAR